MLKFLSVFFLSFSLLGVSFTSVFVPSTAKAGSECDGYVRGLSKNYNPSKGTGFLAVRAGPSSSSAMLAHLFNGDHVVVLDYANAWWRVSYNGGRNIGWVFAKYVKEVC